LNENKDRGRRNPESAPRNPEMRRAEVRSSAEKTAPAPNRKDPNRHGEERTRQGGNPVASSRRTTEKRAFRDETESSRVKSAGGETIKGTGVGKAEEIKRKKADGRETDHPDVKQKKKVRADVPAENRSLVAQIKEKRQLKAAEKERKWQEDVVRVRGGVDKIMLAIILILVCLGSIMVFSASYPVAIAEGKDSLFYVKKQIGVVSIGSVIMIAASYFPYRWYKKWGPFAAYGISVILLIAVLFIGKSEGEAKRWIGVGGFTIQPSELMKVSLVLILAWYIEKYKRKIFERRNLGQTLAYNVLFPCLFMGVACGLIMLEKHLSGTIITAVVAYAVVVVGGCHFGWTTLTYFIGGAAAAGAFLAMNPYALKRITTFTDANADKLDELYQTTQGIYAIGSGGLFGLGFGQSRQKYSYVSAAHTDFIFSIWCEEMGFIGGVLLVALFLAFIWRGYVIASRAPDTFSMLTAFGITTHVGLQAFLNMCVASDIIPNTGISLPFFSYGGSSLLVLLGEMGLLLSISRQYYRKKSDLEREQMIKEMM